MSRWEFNNPDMGRAALENIYMLARKKRVVRYSYPPGSEPISIGPRSDDAGWDHVIRFCEEAGLRPIILRTLDG